jgi:hypothetical protein
VALRRYTSYGAASLDYRRATLHFAREYSFRDLKANNALLVGVFVPKDRIVAIPGLTEHEGYFGVALVLN